MEVPQLSGNDNELAQAATQAAAQAQAEIVTTATTNEMNVATAGELPVQVEDHDDDEVVPVLAGRGQYKNRAALQRENAELKRALAQARAQIPPTPGQQLPLSGEANRPAEQDRYGFFADIPSHTLHNEMGVGFGFSQAGSNAVEESFANLLERERGWTAKMAMFKSLPEFAHMTPADWASARSRFMDECAEIQASKRRRVEKDEAVSSKNAKVDEPTVKPNLGTWSSPNGSMVSPGKYITALIPWYFSLVNPHVSADQLGDHFQNLCVQAISSISSSFFAVSGQNLPEVRHHHHLAMTHIRLGVALIMNPSGLNWRPDCLSWYQHFLGLCLAIWFHRKADVCTRVIVNRGTRISTPTPAKTWQEVRISEVDFYSTLWGEVTFPENFEKWYKAAEHSNLVAYGKLGSNTGPTMIKSAKDLNQTKAGAKANPENTLSGLGNGQSL